MDGEVGRLRDGLRRCQFAVLLQHHLVGKLGDGGVRVGYGQQRLYQRVAGVVNGVALVIQYHFGDDVGVNAVAFAYFAPQRFYLVGAVAQCF